MLPAYYLLILLLPLASRLLTRLTRLTRRRRPAPRR